MLSKIWGAIKEFFGLFKTLFEFVIGLVEDIGKVVSMLADAVVNLPGYFSVFFPSALISLFMVVISVVVIYKVLGREG